jgi:YidC/Oxa1 family membrane protein insertase
MEKRTILAIGLSVLVFMAFTYYQQKFMRPLTTTRPAVQTNLENTAVNTAENKEAPKQETDTPAVSVSAESDTKATSQKRVVSSEQYKAVVDNQGAVLKSWQLNKYKTSLGGVFEMISPARGNEILPYPGALLFKDQSLTNLANKEFYEISVDGGSFENIAAPATIIMKLKRGDLEIEKRFSFNKDKYTVNLSVVAQKGGKQLDYQFFLGQDIGPDAEHVTSTTQLEAVYYEGGKVKRESPPKDEKEIKKIEGDIRWIGLDMQYFTEIVYPSTPLAYFKIQRIPIKIPELDGKATERNLLRVTTPVDGSLQYELYMGPKNPKDLAAVKTAYSTEVINYGFFSIVVKPLLTVLKWIHQYVNNYGFAIIILTLLLSLILFPFRLKQMHSMKRMQTVQPEVKAIQDKYKKYKKTDPKRAEMNQEVMAVYKKHGVNPMGGCLPLLLQMPILWAFYSMLQNSIELRQAPFIWYIHDLSVKDPYYALPIIMGITMFISQKMTPMSPSTDPTAAKMMLIMPVMFTFMFFNVSSGLNLYFLCSNIFQIAFQKIAERWQGDGRSAVKSRA